MKRIIDYRKLFDIKQDADLAKLKTVYRNLMKEWHPDKFKDNETQLAEAEEKSKRIIEAYHFLVSVSPETQAANLEEYTLMTTTFGVDDFQYKGTLYMGSQKQAMTFIFDTGSSWLWIPSDACPKT